VVVPSLTTMHSNRPILKRNVLSSIALPFTFYAD
jgi:hypothetical protein